MKHEDIPDEFIRFTSGFIQGADGLWGERDIDMIRAGLAFLAPESVPVLRGYIAGLLKKSTTEAQLREIFASGYADYSIRPPSTMRDFFTFVIKVIDDEGPEKALRYFEEARRERTR